MAFIERNGIYVPGGLATTRPNAVAQEWTEGLDEELVKALNSKRGKWTPRQIMPSVARLGLYRGVKDPAGATLRTARFLRGMMDAPLIRAILTGFLNEARSYCVPAVAAYDKGFEIYHEDEDAEVSTKDRDRMDGIREHMLEGGIHSRRPDDGALGVWNADFRMEALPLPQMLAALLLDSLVLDWATLYMEPGNNPSIAPVGFMLPLDAAMIRRTEQPPAKGEKDHGLGYVPQIRHDIRVEFVEINDQMKVVNEYQWDEVAPLVRNHRTDFFTHGYGWPELASLIEIVAGMVTSVEHNVAHFTTNAVPPGLVTISGSYNEEAAQDFVWQLVRPGTSGDAANRLPILFGVPGEEMRVDYTRFQTQERQDMYWKNWLSFLMAAACAVWHIAPEDVNFQSFLTVGGLQTGTGGEQRAFMQRSKGFVSLMNDLESFINRRIVSRFFADKTGFGPYRFRWTNLEAREEEKDQERQIAEMQAGLYNAQDLRRKRDERLIRDPLDRAKYQSIEKWVRRNRPDIAKYQDRFLDLIERIYENDGGEWALWPEAPAQPMLMTIWQAEHEQAEGGGEEEEEGGAMPPGMMGGPAEEPEEEEAPPWDFTGERERRRDRERAGGMEGSELPFYLQEREDMGKSLLEIIEQRRQEPSPHKPPKLVLRERKGLVRRAAEAVGHGVRRLTDRVVEITIPWRRGR